MRGYFVCEDAAGNVVNVWFNTKNKQVRCSHCDTEFKVENLNKRRLWLHSHKGWKVKSTRNPKGQEMLDNGKIKPAAKKT